MPALKNIDIDRLIELADEYCDYCINQSYKEVPTAKGAVKIRERHLPTIDYFLNHWLRQKHFEFYKRSNWYDAKKNEEHPYSDTIKKIDDNFRALATDIVANEQKGIFYAKNYLGMTDRVETKNDTKLSGDINITLNLD